jgi:hypothetical protein
VTLAAGLAVALAVARAKPRSAKNWARPVSLCEHQTMRGSSRTVVALGLCWPLAAGCGKGEGPSLNRAEGELPDVPVPDANGPRLGAIANTTPVRRLPERDAKIIGYLHAGSSVARAAEPYSTDDCAGGWYPIRPRGFVCLDEGATLDLRHPTLVTMAILPSLDLALPYTYARNKEDTPTYEVDPEKEQAVRRVGSLPAQSGAAVVGSWEASDEAGQSRRLAMLSDGRFLDASTLERAEASEFAGVELGEKFQLPVGFVVKRGISSWDLAGAEAKRDKQLEVHDVLALTGRFRTLADEKFWEQADGSWVRHRDVTLAVKREQMPKFVDEKRRWIDVSIVAGTAVAYVGSTPVYATLVSVGSDRLGEGLSDVADSQETPSAMPKDAKLTQRGEFTVVSKHITALNANPAGFANRVEMHDVPWVLELASGQLLHGAFWHKRFGVEHGPGNVQLSPADARWIWSWATPEVPPGWHAVTELAPDEQSTFVNIRK